MPAAPRIAIISPNRKVYSETFIAAHIERLEGVALVLTDGHLPARHADGTPLLSTSPWSRLVRRLTGSSAKDALRSAVARALRADRIDVVLAEYGPTAAAMLPICRELGLPLVAHFHGVDAFHVRLLREHDDYREVFAHAAAVIAVSREMEEQLATLGAPRERLHYKCYGIDTARFTVGDPAKAGKNFIGIGRFVDKKAPHLTILAFQKALQQDPDLALMIAGTGPLWEACRQLVATLHLEDRVSLPGVLPHEDIAERMRSARAFVQHSVVTAENDHEGTPLAVLEAMASGLPVIATRHAGIPDVVEHGVHGLLCAERDIDAMAANMLAVARDPEAARSMGRAGRERIEKDLSMQDHIAALEAILRNAAQH